MFRIFIIWLYHVLYCSCAVAGLSNSSELMVTRISSFRDSGSRFLVLRKHQTVFHLLWPVPRRPNSYTIGGHGSITVVSFVDWCLQWPRSYLLSRTKHIHRSSNLRTQLWGHISCMLYLHFCYRGTSRRLGERRGRAFCPERLRRTSWGWDDPQQQYATLALFSTIDGGILIFRKGLFGSFILRNHTKARPTGVTCAVSELKLKEMISVTSAIAMWKKASSTFIDRHLYHIVDIIWDEKEERISSLCWRSCHSDNCITHVYFSSINPFTNPSFTNESIVLCIISFTCFNLAPV